MTSTNTNHARVTFATPVVNTVAFSPRFQSHPQVVRHHDRPSSKEKIGHSVVSWPRPDRERILDVLQEGRSSKLRVSCRARLIVLTCNNSKHLAYMNLLRISTNTGAKEQKGRDSGNQSSNFLGVCLDWSKTELRHLCFENCVLLMGGKRLFIN